MLSLPITRTEFRAEIIFRFSYYLPNYDIIDSNQNKGGEAVIV